MSAESKILILYTGGTIGMVADEGSGALRPYAFENLLAYLPELGRLPCQLDTDTFDEPIDSANIVPADWARLANRIACDYYQYDGFVILHGSDTLAFTSSALSFMLENLSKPVILTGSQLPVGIPRSDARENLLTALEIALARNEEGGARVPEVAVYFEYDLLRGNRLHKASSMDFEAFQSVNYPKLAEAGVQIRYNDKYIARSSTGAFSVNDHWNDQVGVLTFYPGINSHYAACILDNPKLQAVILRTFGSGNIPGSAWLLDKLRAAIGRGVKLINLSQCDGGGVFPGQYESGRALLEMGVLNAGDMTFEAALTKAMHLLGQEDLSEDTFRQLYQANLKGERTEY